MAKQYSVQFFTSFVNSLQEVCRNYLSYSQFVEVSGYVCVEIDNMKKERYVLSELLHSSGNMVSESYCTKAFKTAPNMRVPQPPVHSVGYQPYSKDVDRRKECNNQSRSLVEHPLHFSPGPKSKRKFGDTELEDPEYSQSFRSVPKRTVFSTDIEHQRYKSSTSTVSGQSFSSEYSSNSTHQHNQSQAYVIQEKKITVPQYFPQSNSKRVSLTDQSDKGSPGSDRQDTRSSDVPPDEDIIDLDQFDDEDFDLPGGLEEDSSAGCSGGAVAALSSLSAGTSNRKSQLSPGSLVAVNNAVKRFRRFISFKYGKDIDLLATTPEELNEMILVFFKESRKKKDGGELAGVSMKNILAYLELFLRDNGYPYSVSKGTQFQTAREYIKNKMEDATKTMAPVMSPVNNEDIEILFQANQLGPHSPDSLTNTMWFLNSKYLTIRRPAEHFSLKWGDIVLKVDKDGNEYLERAINDSFGLKLFSNPMEPDRCFVNFYKLFRAHRPKLCLDESAPFYLKPNKSPGDEYWMSPEPISWHGLCSIWRKMVLSAGLPQNKRIV